MKITNSQIAISVEVGSSKYLRFAWDSWWKLVEGRFEFVEHSENLENRYILTAKETYPNTPELAER